MFRYLPSICLVSLYFFLSPVQASWLDKLADTLGDESAPSKKVSSSLSNEELVGAFKEALEQGSTQVVSRLGAVDGFAKDSRIRIPLPKNLQKARKFAKQVGMAKPLDDLEQRLNRAAEHATPKAKQLFIDAIQKMSFDDVREIYKGSNDAATRYFQRQVSDKLGLAMAPVIRESLSEVGALQAYDKLVADYKDVPLVPDLKADLTRHVVDGGLAGIFHYLSEQEAAIRQDPVRQTTTLLKKVFGQ